MASIKEDAIVLDWEGILKKAPAPVAKTPTGTSVEVGHPLSGTTIDNQTEGVQNEAGDLTIVDQLAAVSTPEEFKQVIQEISRDVVEDAIACQDTQPKRQQLSQWYEQGQLAAVEVVEPKPIQIVEVVEPKPIQIVEVLEPKPIQIKVGDRLRLAKDLLTVTSGKVVRVLEAFGDWFETSWGAVSFTEIELGTWELIPPGVACKT
jgi:hypothetical protein